MSIVFVTGAVNDRFFIVQGFFIQENSEFFCPWYPASRFLPFFHVILFFINTKERDCFIK